MIRRLLALSIFGVFSAAIAAAQSGPVSQVPPDETIRKILAERIDGQHQGVGMVVGVIEPQGQRTISYGALAKGDPRPLNGDTVFEIGSITKVFTSLLLADAVVREEVTLKDPVSKYLPSDVKPLERSGRSITLQDLSQHTSALPRLPGNMAPKDPRNPYADYSVAQLYQFLSSVQLARDVGSQYEYSNLGGGLLGHALARRAGMDYEALLRLRVTGPLGLKDTTITLSSDQRTRLAQGYDQALQPASNWDLPTLAGAGALRSTANDMLTFLAAAIGTTQTPLAGAMGLMPTVRRPAAAGVMDIALGWHIATANGKDIIWHNGGTGGYRSFIGYDAKARVGVVVLSNASTSSGPDDIGRHLLDPQIPLRTAATASQAGSRTQIAVDPSVLDSIVGRYQLAPGAILIVTRDGDRAFAQLTGQPAFEIFPESDRKFFYKVVDAQLSFERNTPGKATAVVLHQNGMDQRAPRIEGEPVVPKEIALDPKVFDRYVGNYELAPGVNMTVSREGTHFYSQLPGQAAVEIFASSEREFFLKVVNAQLTFEVDAQGKVIAAVMHQNGRDRRVPRIE